MGAMSRNKGARGERAVVTYLAARGHKARRFLAGDGNQPGDIDWRPDLAIEVKNAETRTIPAWWRQTVAEADGRTPVLIYRPDGVTLDDVGRWHVVIEADHYFDLVERT